MLPVIELDRMAPELIEHFDFLVLGAPVYMGHTLHKDWLKRHEAALKQKKLFHFIVCGTQLSQQEKLDGIVKYNIPASLQQPSSAWFLRGRVIQKKLSWADRLMIKIGAKMEKDPGARKAMLQDFDEVKKENIRSLVKAVNIYTLSVGAATPA